MINSYIHLTKINIIVLLVGTFKNINIYKNKLKNKYNWL